MKKLFSAAACLVALISITSVVAAKTVTVTDMAGRSVTAPVDPRRIVCIGPGTLRLIVYLHQWCAKA